MIPVLKESFQSSNRGRLKLYLQFFRRQLGNPSSPAEEESCNSSMAFTMDSISNSMSFKEKLAGSNAGSLISSEEGSLKTDENCSW